MMYPGILICECLVICNKAGVCTRNARKLLSEKVTIIRNETRVKKKQLLLIYCCRFYIDMQSHKRLRVDRKGTSFFNASISLEGLHLMKHGRVELTYQNTIVKQNSVIRSGISSGISSVPYHQYEKMNDTFLTKCNSGRDPYSNIYI